MLPAPPPSLLPLLLRLRLPLQNTSKTTSWNCTCNSQESQIGLKDDEEDHRRSCPAQVWMSVNTSHQVAWRLQLYVGAACHL